MMGKRKPIMGCMRDGIDPLVLNIFYFNNENEFDVAK